MEVGRSVDDSKHRCIIAVVHSSFTLTWLAVASVTRVRDEGGPRSVSSTRVGSGGPLHVYSVSSVVDLCGTGNVLGHSK